MSTALIAAATALLVFILGKVPGFTGEARTLDRLKKELEIHALMPDGEARDRLGASIEHDVENLLSERDVRQKARDSFEHITGRTRLERTTEVLAMALLVVAFAFAFFANALGIPGGHENGRLFEVLGVVASLVIAMTLALADRAARRKHRRDRG
ncbi:hypothetical protein [Promicromonospora sp. NFX87]|uniref:hypothetical protein n=1 Tax=Promicromonospora sp. NFX87 TaxID=3402691 RepID=UPI003AFB10E6